jgi:hypothetical protein
VKGILLRTDEVRAMLDGRKTQTRRPITPQPEFAQEYWYQGKKLYECVERTTRTIVKIHLPVIIAKLILQKQKRGGKPNE